MKCHYVGNILIPGCWSVVHRYGMFGEIEYCTCKNSNAQNMKTINLYRKKPVVIEALIFNEDNYVKVKSFCPNIDIFQHPKTLDMHGSILTLEGIMEISPGDYLIKGIKGEFYPCKPDIFEATYEKV